MFSFFKRSDKESEQVTHRPNTQAKRPSKNTGLDARDPLPLPQVIEGNEDSDWAMWEDSVRERDSRMPSQFQDTVPSEFSIEQHGGPNSDSDPFAKIDRQGA
jgi:hypothetical protein